LIVLKDQGPPMLKDSISRIKPFDEFDYLQLRDIERCPYVWNSPKCIEWNKQDKQRMLLIALERYAHYLTTTRRLPGRNRRKYER
jgi:hypothetical protein